LIDRLGVRSDARVGTMSAGEIRRGEAYLLIKSSLGRKTTRTQEWSTYPPEKVHLPEQRWAA
jgi:hypothetical protein